MSNECVLRDAHGAVCMRTHANEGERFVSVGVCVRRMRACVHRSEGEHFESSSAAATGSSWRAEGVRRAELTLYDS
jgi:hypothetical protein